VIRFLARGADIEVELTGSEAPILLGLPELLGSAGVDKGDPAQSRLYPIVYRDDEDASREYERLAAKERAAVRSADRERFREILQTAGKGPLLLGREDAAVWARVLGEARIVLAARHGLFDSGLPSQVPSDPEVALVMLLGYMQEELVGEMLKTMEDES
jgi:hypothetical protein